MSVLIINVAMMLVQILFIIIFAPLLTGIIKKTKAVFQLRKGASVFQPYRDLIKLFRKEAIVSYNASWIFSATPVISFAAIIVTSVLIPIWTTSLPLGFAGDIIAIIYLFALARFFIALAGLDTASAFGGMGSSREMFVASLVEPGMMLSIFAIAANTSSTSLSHITQNVSAYGIEIITPSYLLAFLAFYILIIAETGRIPVDNPTTHLELTMIHEAMLLEYSGKQLALIELTTMIKHLLVYSLFASVFIPWGIFSDTSMLTGSAIASSVIFYLIKIMIIGVCVSLTELSTAKWRLFRLPELLSISLMLSLLSIVSFVIVRGV